MDDNASIGAGGCVFAIAAFLIGIPLGALAISLTWNWFVVPLLHVPEMGMASAIGIRMFVTAIWMPMPPRPDPNENLRERLYSSGGMLIGGPIVTIILAFIWHSITG